MLLRARPFHVPPKLHSSPDMTRAAALHCCAACAPLRAALPSRRNAFIAAGVLFFTFVLWTHFCRAWGSLIRTLRVNKAEVHVATMHGFGTLSAAAMLDELWIIGRLFPSSRPLIPISSWLPFETQLAAADIVLVSVYGPRKAVESAIRNHPRASWLFVCGENVAVSGDWWDLFIPGVDLSMGQRHENSMRATAASAGASYIHTPWWLPYTLDRHERGRCPLPSALLRPGNAAAWRSRGGFACILSSHYNYPRRDLFGALSSIGHVTSPGGAFHNSEWPADLPRGHLDGKPAFITRFRFNICPENSLSVDGDGGYSTEKLPQALAAGTVPVYWGDAVEPSVFNPARFLRFNGSVAAITEAVAHLESNTAASDAFFSQPALLPTAQAWVDAWCDRAAAHFEKLVSRVDERRAGVARLIK
jgi:hypothetical protein